MGPDRKVSNHFSKLMHCSFKLPSNLRLENLEGLTKEAGQNEGQQNSAIAQVFASYVDPGLGWDFIAWVRTVTKLPLILKVIVSLSWNNEKSF